MTKRSKPSVVAALRKRFAAADTRYMELLLRSGDFPSPADVAAWNAWHVERAEVAEELADIYSALLDTEDGIGGLVWRSFELTRQYWRQQAEQHRAHIKQIGDNRE